MTRCLTQRFGPGKQQYSRLSHPPYLLKGFSVQIFFNIDMDLTAENVSTPNVDTEMRTRPTQPVCYIDLNLSTGFDDCRVNAIRLMIQSRIASRDPEREIGQNIYHTTTMTVRSGKILTLDVRILIQHPTIILPPLPSQGLQTHITPPVDNLDEGIRLMLLWLQSVIHPRILLLYPQRICLERKVVVDDLALVPDLLNLNPLS